MYIPVRNFQHDGEQQRKRRETKMHLKGEEKCVSCPQFVDLVKRILVKRKAIEKETIWADSFINDEVFPALENIINGVQREMKFVNSYLWEIPMKFHSQTGMSDVLRLCRANTRCVLKYEEVLSLKIREGKRKRNLVCSFDVFSLYRFYIENEPDEFVDFLEHFKKYKRVY